MTRLAVFTATTVVTTALAAVAGTGTAHADLEELKWATEGYFRTRTVYLSNLAPMDRVERVYPVNGETVVVPDIRNTSYMMSRLRLMPSLSFEKLAKLYIQIDALDDVLWGDNDGFALAPLFATDSSNQPYLGGPQGGFIGDTVQVKRAWVEFQVPVGLMRVGRMPSHWGLGLLANGGGTGNWDPASPLGEPRRKVADHFLSDDFGDKHFGSTADRILFVTKPMSIYKTITKAGDVSSNFIMGYAYDKLAEAPLLPFEDFERNFRPLGTQGFISRGSNDDVDEHVAIVAYSDADWDQVRYTDELRLGFYGVYRTQHESSTQPNALDPAATCGQFEGEPVPCVDTGSDVYIMDLWWKLRYGSWYTQGEAYYIFGETFGGVPFPIRNRKKKANITGGVAQFGYYDPNDVWDVVLEVGHSSGDEFLSDEDFKQRPLHPDHNVGLILFEETLRELSARVYGLPLAQPELPYGAFGLFSNGGVINANYVYPRAHYRLPIPGISITGAVLSAWVDELSQEPLAMFVKCGATCAPGQTNSSHLGTEVDVALKAQFAGKMHFSLETGYLRFGEALKSVLTNADSSFTFQTSLAFVW